LESEIEQLGKDIETKKHDKQEKDFVKMYSESSKKGKDDSKAALAHSVSK
jgi:hypothetical protein